METQTQLSRHNKFISAENIVGIFSVSSDDSFTCSVLLLLVDYKLFWSCGLDCMICLYFCASYFLDFGL